MHMTCLDLLPTLKHREQQLKPCAPYAVKIYVLLYIFLELAKYHYSKGDVHSGMAVLYKFIEPLKTFILNIKAVAISAKSSVKFVKKGAKVPCKRTPPVSVLHHASNWVLLADLNSNYCFPVHIVFT